VSLFFKQKYQVALDNYNQLFHDYYVDLCRFAFTFVKDSDASEEIVQEVFIALWEKRHSLEISHSIRSFLYTSVKNKALNYVRDNNTRTIHEAAFANEQTQEFAPENNSCEYQQLEESVEKAIAELPEQCKRIYIMSRYENLTYKQIANQLEISPKTVENQLGIALKKLRTTISPIINTVFIFFL